MMTPLENIQRSEPPSSVSRRFFMGGSAAIICTLIVGSPLLKNAIAAATEDAPSKVAFINVSHILTAHADLPLEQTERMYKALSNNNPAFPDQIQNLQAFISERKLNASTLQAALDAEKSPFAGVPRDILQAWYVGVVGSGEKAFCVAYEDALMNLAVSDQLRPPSYAYGAYGSWSAQPKLG